MFRDNVLRSERRILLPLHFARRVGVVLFLAIGCCLAQDSMAASDEAEPEQSSYEPIGLLTDSGSQQTLRRQNDYELALTETAQSPQPQGNQTVPKKNNSDIEKPRSTLVKMRDLPIVWLIGPYVPSDRPLQPLTAEEREEAYLRQTFLTAGSYLARLFNAGIGQARDVPSGWGGGMEGYGRRFGSLYGQFVIQSSVQAAGDAALGYESRYDLCKCSGLWPRTRHAIVRNFVTYNSTERQIRPQIPLYTGALAAGMMSSLWLPGRRSAWQEGGHSVLSQVGYGSAINVVSEFAFDILHKLGMKKR
jgi:hypothetical protein